MKIRPLVSMTRKKMRFLNSLGRLGRDAVCVGVQSARGWVRAAMRRLPCKRARLFPGLDIVSDM